MEKHWADCDGNGYVDRDWSPLGWGAPAPLESDGVGDSASPATTRPVTPQPPTEASKPADIVDRIADIEQDRANKTQNDPVTDETVKTDDDTQLRPGTPPEDEIVLAKNLLNQAKSKNGAVLYLPDSFTGDPKDYEQTKPFWVGDQFIYGESQKMMNGRVNVKMTRWIAKEKGYTVEELDDLPF